MKLRHIFLFLAVLAPFPSYAGNDFWLGNTYTVSLSFDVAGLGRINAPTPKTLLTPDFPREFIDLGVSGYAVLEFEVRKSGKIGRIRVLDSYSPAFAAQARADVLNWRFLPATESMTGKITTATMQCRIDYIVEENRPNK